MKKFTALFIVIGFSITTYAQLANVSSQDSVLVHKLHRDAEGKTLAWFKPEVPGAAYSHVMKLASEFLVNTCPTDEKTGLPLYLVTCCFHKPDLNGNRYVGEDWPHNPACVYAGIVQSLAIDYYTFSGDQRMIDLTAVMLDYQLGHGTTPAGWVWEKVPYASSDPFEKEYQGATRWEAERYRGDGLHVIEPDKVGELGYAYLRFYQVTENKIYLDAAINCANALAKHVRVMPGENSPFIESTTKQSPWPFRVNARTGTIISEYCSNIIEPVKLFDELMRLNERLQLDTATVNSYQRARNIAWNWLYSRGGPMHTYIWNAYFEDIPNDEEQANRTQITPGEVARYLVKNPQADKNIEKDVPALLSWVASVFKTDGYDAIKEQTWCFEPMGSHTARYGSVCALWYEKTGDPHYKEEAFRFLNFASYMTLPDGFVAVGPNWPGAWFSDGYSDYIRHFADALAAVPEWSPRGENHLLRSSSVVQSIFYRNDKIDVVTFDDSGSLKCVLVKKPKQVLIGGINAQFSWQSFKHGGGELTFTYTNSKKIEIVF